MADHVPPLYQTLACQSKQEEESQQTIWQHFTNFVSTLPSVDCGAIGILSRHHDGWYAGLAVMVGAMVAQRHFKARPTDVLLVSLPKSGTTWLKALLFSTVHRRLHVDSSRHPLATLGPHDCIPFIESQVYVTGQIPALDSLPSPRLFSTHIPFQSLPKSVVDSGCPIVYLCRDPKDNFISHWHFVNKVRANHESIEVALDRYCRGISPFGPYWDHMLGYWRAHLEGPHQVLFLRYEELKEAPVDELRRLAMFVGCPFSLEEEQGGVAEEIVRLCGIENLSNLEVNKTGSTEFAKTLVVENSSFFRRGVVGDWVNHLTLEMARRLDEVTESKLKGSGLAF